MGIPINKQINDWVANLFVLYTESTPYIRKPNMDRKNAIFVVITLISRFVWLNKKKLDPKYVPLWYYCKALFLWPLISIFRQSFGLIMVWLYEFVNPLSIMNIYHFICTHVYRIVNNVFLSVVLYQGTQF